MRSKLLILGLLLGCFLVLPGIAQAQRIKDLVSVEGIRENQLTGYGLVVGLDGTGDQTTQTPFTTQSINNLLKQSGVYLPEISSTTMRLKNVAAVMVTASMPAYAQIGQVIDVTVSSMGNASSLRGGTLVMTPLKGADGQIYAVAQGNLLIGGSGASQDGNSVKTNQLNAGLISDGATIERLVPTILAEDGVMRMDLGNADFTTASRIVNAINQHFGLTTAFAQDERVILVRVPQSASEQVVFLSEMENIEVNPGQMSAKVVLNARTGSVVMNQVVRLDACAISHGDLTVVVTSTPIISQPGAFSNGRTVVQRQTQIGVNSQPGKVMELDGGPTLSDVVEALNSIGATPQDLLSILQVLKVAGSLHADLEII